VIVLDCNVVGVEHVQANLLGLPRSLRLKLVEAMVASTIEVGAAARAAAPRSATPGKYGHMADSIRTSVQERRDAVVGKVWAPGAYEGRTHGFVARFIEGGVDADVKVRSYVRHNASADVHATGKRGQTLKRLSHVGVELVKGYTRSVHIAARPFFRPAYEGKRSAIELRIAAAIESACAEANT
jgi:hypothetical protein